MAMNAMDYGSASTARKLAWVIDEFRKIGASDHGGLEAATLQVFFLIAANPGIRMKEIEKATSLSPSAVSRNVLALSERSWKKGPDGKFGPGLDLIVTASDPFDPRAKVATLTPKGRRLFDKFHMIVGGKAPV
jgi:DNA-binding MarR family transcriptional regulator